jgi:hypothetical protein
MAGTFGLSPLLLTLPGDACHREQIADVAPLGGKSGLGEAGRESFPVVDDTDEKEGTSAAAEPAIGGFETAATGLKRGVGADTRYEYESEVEIEVVVQPENDAGWKRQKSWPSTTGGKKVSKKDKDKLKGQAGIKCFFQPA